MPRTTPLYPLHAALGAKLVDFAGWMMPLHYGSQLEEHRQVRSHAGMFDVSHMRVAEIEGPDAHALLGYALANDIRKLRSTGRALYSCLLNENGGIVDDLIVYFVADSHYRAVLNAATGEPDIDWLSALAQRRAIDATVSLRPTFCIIAVQGPDARERVWSALPGSREASSHLKPFEAAWLGKTMIARTGYTGEDGFEIVLPDADALTLWRALHTQGVRPCGLGARDTLRLEAGMNLYGQDMDESVTPYECGLGWTVDLKSNRDFCGRAALAQREPRFQMLGLVLSDKGVLRAHQTVHCASGSGAVTSGTYSPTLGKSIALARVPLDARIGEEVQVTIRDKQLKAVLTKPRFVRNGKALV